MALLLGGPPRHAGDLEGVRVVAQHQQLVPAAKRHAGGHVKVPAHVAAGVVGLMLLLVNLQQDVAPRSRQGKVREGVRRLRLQPAAAEGQVVLVLEGDLRVAERLVHLKLLTLGHCARVVAVHRSHVFQQALRPGKRVVLEDSPGFDTQNCRSRSSVPAVACADTGIRRRSRGTCAAVAHACRRTRRRSHGTDTAAARAGTSSQAGAQVSSLNTFSVFLHVPTSGDANERARIEAAV